jgi:CRISPR-associated protein Csd1
MSALASLVHAYDRLAERSEAPVFGYSVEKIGFLISLNEDGTTAGPPIDLRGGEGKKRTPHLIPAPQPTKRTSGIAPNFLWDKTSYVLGVTAGEGKRTNEEHAAFVAKHKEQLRDSNDDGLRAFLRFLESWRPEDFASLGWPDEMKDKNVVFALESERRGSGNSIYCIHNRPAALALWARISAAAEKSNAICLITGENAPVARLHPAIKGIRSPGGGKDADSLVSFNIDAFTSYGHEQGNNAPVSEAAAFAYTTALNHFLERDSGHRVQIGDASTVFWADALDAAAAEESEDIFATLLGVDEKVEAKKVGVILDAIRQGRPIAELKPDLPQGVRFYVLGLSPNAARLSVRFFIEDDFGEIASRYLAHVERMRLDPLPRDNAPSIWRLLIETASQRKSENIPPNLAGEWLRAILTGTPYPLTLLSTLLMRLRADHDINALRAAILKSVLIRNFEMEVPLSLDPKNDDPGYLLGRLFAVLEKTQTLAQGRVNASIKDRYYGAASATPRTVFPLLLRLNVHHQGKAEGKSKGLAGYFAQQLSEIMNKLPTEFPATLNLRRQGTFALGYFHQINWRKNAETSEPATTIQE